MPARGTRSRMWLSRAANSHSDLRSLEAYTAAALSLGATELATAEPAGRDLTTAAPFRESGFRLLMQALTARGNSAEALLVYDQLVQRLRDELAVPPSAETRVLHSSILRTSQPDGR